MKPCELCGKPGNPTTAGRILCDACIARHNIVADKKEYGGIG